MEHFNEDLERDIAILNKLNQEKEQNFKKLIWAIRTRAAKRVFIRLSAVAAVITIMVSVYSLVKDTPDNIPTTIATIDAKSPTLITDSGEQINLTDDYSYTLDYPVNSGEDTGLQMAGKNNTAKKRVVTKNASQNTVVIPVGYTYNIKFDDGSEAFINAGSNIRYPETFSTLNQRVIELDGEGYFKVAKSNKPFIVKTSHLELTVYGTEFNLNTNKTGIVETILVEGSVGIKEPGGKSETMLKPNEMAVYNIESHSATVESVNPQDYLAWMKGDFLYNNESLHHLIDEINAHYNIDITCAPQMREQFVSISLSRKLGYKQIMEILEMAFGVEFTEIDNNKYICKDNF